MGGRRLLAAVVFMWSLSTVCTPLVAGHYHLLLLARVILGLGEGLGLPTIYHLFAEHVPVHRRSTAFSYLTAAAGVGQTIAAVVSARACDGHASQFVPHMAWRSAFYAFGMAGFVWCAVWARGQRVIGDASALNNTDTKQPVGASLLLCKQTTNPLRQWQQFFTKTPLLAIYAAHFAMNWMSYTIMHWLPTYLRAVFGADPTDLSLAAAPYVANSVCAVGKCGVEETRAYICLHFAVIGHLADDWVNSGRASLLSVRKYCTFAGLMLPALLLLAFAFVTHLYTAIL
jgi:MFS family permease